MKKISKILAVVLSVLMVLSAFPISAFALETEMEAAQEITVDQPFEVATFENGGHKWFKFVPEVSGTYTFYSFNSDFDTRAYAYDSSGEFITEDDDGGEDNNFKITLQMDAGQTYYFKSMPFSEDSTGRYTVSLNKLQQAESFSIHNTEEIVVYKGVNFSIYPTFFPADSLTEKLVTAEAETEDVLYTYAYEDYVDFSAENVGSTLLTVTTENGLTDTIEITVLEPEEITLNETKNYVINSTYASQGYVFKPSKDGAYKVSITSENDNFYSFTDLWDEEDNQIAYESGYDYYFTANLEAEKEYLIFSKNNTPNSNESSELSITIEEAVFPTAITINAPTEKIYKYQEFELDCTVEPANANVLNFEWSIEDCEIIGYNGDNRFYPVNIGTTTITAVAGNGVSDSIEIEISPYENISLNDTKTVSLGNGIYQRFYSFTPQESGDYTFKFNVNTNFSNYYAISDSENCELVYTWGSRENLSVTLNKDETYTVLIQNYNEEDGTVELTVTKAVAPETFEIITYNHGQYYVDDFIWLETSLTPEGCSKVINWSSSNEAVASCDQDGYVWVTGVGTATITGTTSNGLTDSFEIVAVEIPEIELNQKYDITVENAMHLRENKFVFSPEESGYYEFSVDYDSWFDARVSVVDGEQLGYFNDSFKCYFEAGNTYSVTMDSSSDFSFKVTEAIGVKSVEILTLPKRMEYVEGHEEFEYYGLTAKVVLEDNTTVIYEYSYDEIAAGYAVEFKSAYDEYGNYEKTLMTVGTASDSFEFIIKENTVESIEYVGGKLELIENSEGHYSKDYFGEEFFHYNYDKLLEDIVVKINFTDRESIIAEYGTKIDGYYVTNDYVDQYENPWTLGSDNYITVSYLGAYVDIPVTIVETPVEKIVVNKAPSKIYYQHDYFSGDLYDEFYARFEDLTGISFTVYFKDGTSKTYTDKDIKGGGYIDGYFLDIEYPYDAELGNVEIIAQYMGAEFSYNVVYKEFPYKVKDVKIVKLPEKLEYPQGYFPDFTGTVVEIAYDDGSTKRVELTKDNMIYEEGHSHQGQILLLVDVDGVALMIDMDYFGDVLDANLFRASYGGVIYNFDDINCVPGKEVASIEASGIKDIVITVNYADGTKEDYRINDAITVGSVKMFSTSNGLIISYFWDWEDEENNVIVYNIDLLGEYVTYEVSKSIGDIDGDGNVNAADLALLKKVIAGLTAIDDESVVNPNVDGEGKTPNAADLALLKKIIAGLV